MTRELKWTQDEAIAFECAREVISDMISIQTGKIANEAEKAQPDAVRIDRLRAERVRLFYERTELRLLDHVRIAQVRAEYGAKVRAWRAQPEMQHA